MKIYHTLFLIPFVSLSFIGCAEDEATVRNTNTANAAPADLSMSVSGTEDATLLGDLSEEQAVLLCEAQAAYLASQISEEQAQRIVCISSAIFGSAFSEEGRSCDEVYNACLAGGSTVEEEEEGCADAGSQIAECSATIGELEACMKEQAETLREFASLTCADLDDSTPIMSDESTSAESACTALSEACPSLKLE